MVEILVGAVIPIVVIIINFWIEKYKSKQAIKQTEYQFKREVLKDIYEKLVSIINQYPNLSPNDALKWVQGAPNYSMESFDSVLQSIDYMIEDYNGQLDNPNINNEKKCNIKTQMINCETAKRELDEISNQYFIAKNEYCLFCKTDKTFLDLYAGQDVRNQLVEFEVTINNVFISGHSVGDVYDPSNNRIDVARRKIVDSIRKDIGYH